MKKLQCWIITELIGLKSFNIFGKQWSFNRIFTSLLILFQSNKKNMVLGQMQMEKFTFEIAKIGLVSLIMDLRLVGKDL